MFVEYFVVQVNDCVAKCNDEGITIFLIINQYFYHYEPLLEENARYSSLS